MNTFKYLVIAALVVIALLMSRSIFFNGSSAGGGALPDISLSDYQDHDTALSSLLGRATVLTFWFPT